MTTFFRLFFTFWISTLAWQSQAQEQRFRAGINVGVTAAQINGDNSASFNKLGFTAGVRTHILLTEKSDVVVEILYSQRGSRTELVRNTGSPQEIIHLNYIEVPVFYTLKDWYQEDDEYYKMQFQAGLSFGRLFSTRFDQSPLEPAGPFFRKTDLSWLGGVTLHVSRPLGFYARYTRSINLLFKNNPSNPNANSLLSFYLTFGGVYVF